MSELDRQTRIVAVTGGRDLLDNHLVTRVLDLINPVHVILGDCKTGADRMALNWAIDNERSFMVHKADWDTHGKAAGPIRNGEMVRDAQNQYATLVAFPGGRGTADCVRQALKAKLTVLTVTSQEGK